MIAGESSADVPAGLQEIVDHRDPVVKIDSEWDRRKPTGLANVALLAPHVELVADGSPARTEMPSGMALETKSHWDGAKLVTDWNVVGLHAPLNGKWTRYMKGPSMVVDAVTETNTGRTRRTLVFARN